MVKSRQKILSDLPRNSVVSQFLLHGCISAWPNCFDCIDAQAYLNLFNNTDIQI